MKDETVNLYKNGTLKSNSPVTQYINRYADKMMERYSFLGVSREEMIEKVTVDFNKYIYKIDKNYAVSFERYFIKRMDEFFGKLLKSKYRKKILDNYVKGIHSINDIKYNFSDADCEYLIMNYPTIGILCKNSGNYNKKIVIVYNERNRILMQGENSSKEAYGILPKVELTDEEVANLIEKIKNGDEEARRTIVSSYLLLVKSIALTCGIYNVPLCDLIGDGISGLYRATEDYDPTRKAKFSTYASWWIRSAIKRKHNSTSRTIKLSHKSEELYTKISRYINLIEKEYGYTPTLEEISHELNINLEIVKSIYETTYVTSIGEEEYIDNRFKNPEEYIIEKDMKERVFDALKRARLTDKELDVFLRRHGYYGEIETQEMVAKKYGVHRSRIAAIDKKAIEKLKLNHKVEQLRVYIERHSPYKEIEISKEEKGIDRLKSSFSSIERKEEGIWIREYESILYQSLIKERINKEIKGGPQR